MLFCLLVVTFWWRYLVFLSHSFIHWILDLYNKFNFSWFSTTSKDAFSLCSSSKFWKPCDWLKLCSVCWIFCLGLSPFALLHVRSHNMSLMVVSCQCDSSKFCIRSFHLDHTFCVHSELYATIVHISWNRKIFERKCLYEIEAILVCDVIKDNGDAIILLDERVFFHSLFATGLSNLSLMKVVGWLSCLHV